MSVGLKGEIVEHLLTEAAIEIPKISLEIAIKYTDFQMEREKALRLLFGNYFFSQESVDTVVGFQKSKGTEFCPTLSGEKKLIKKVFDKSWDLEGANRANLGLFSTLLYAIEKDRPQDQIKMPSILESVLDLTFVELAYLEEWLNKANLKRVALEDRCSDFDLEDKAVKFTLLKASLEKPSKKLIVLGGFAPSKIAEAIHYDLDFQFGLEPNEKRRLIDEAEKIGFHLNLNRDTTKVDSMELKQLRQLLAEYDADHGLGIFAPTWVIIENKTGKILTRRKIVTNCGKKDTVKDGIIFAFMKNKEINGEKKDVIALMGMGAAATVVSPNVVLIDPSVWLMNNEFEKKLTDVAGFGNEFQAVIEFEFNRKYTKVGTPFLEGDIKRISNCWVKQL